MLSTIGFILLFIALGLSMFWPYTPSHLQPSSYFTYLIAIKQKTVINGLLFVSDEFDNYFMVQNCNANHGRDHLNARACKPIWDAIITNKNYSVITTYDNHGYKIINNGMFIHFDPDDPFITEKKYPFIVYMKDSNNNTIVDNFYQFDPSHMK